MEHKTFEVQEIKALTDSDEPGTFEAIVAVFGNVDRTGDRIKKGAFKRTLEERGLPPIIWSHNWEIPPIGVVQKATENSEGLRIKGRLFVGEGEDSPMARQVYTALTAKDGNGQPPLREFSFGYEPREYSEEKTKKDGTVRVLEDIELYEIGPTLIGMNPATRLIGAKALRDLADELEQTDTSARDEDAGDSGEASPPDGGEEPSPRITELLLSRPSH